MAGRFSLRALAFTQAMLLLATLLLPALVAAATIQTDLFVYNDGDTVNVTGVDYGANEVVDFVTTDPDGTVVDDSAAAGVSPTSDDQGNVAYSFTLHATQSGLYTVVGTGQTSGYTASTQFDPAGSATATFPADGGRYSTTAGSWNAGCATSPFSTSGICGSATGGKLGSTDQ